MRPVRLFALLAVVALALCVGCEKGDRLPETGATLEGTITYNGQPVQVAMVIVQGTNGSATGWVESDGRYKVQNCPLGDVNLAVNTEAGKGQARGAMMAKSQGANVQLPKIVDVPAKYGDPAQSGIKTNIHAGQNTYDITIGK